MCGRGINGLWCALSTGYEFKPASLWTSHFSDANGWSSQPSYWSTIQFPDLNGDQRQDVCGRSSTGLFCALSSGESVGAFFFAAPGYSDANGWAVGPEHWSTIRFLDFNGDGKQDVCGRATTGLYCGTEN